ncbi:hypothetical protein CYMTET_7112, partial [Cymbomonas tetramitiformis]
MRTLCQLDTPTQRNTHLCDVPLHELVVFLREQFELFISPLEYHHEQVQHRGENFGNRLVTPRVINVRDAGRWPAGSYGSGRIVVRRCSAKTRYPVRCEAGAASQ